MPTATNPGTPEVMPPADPQEASTDYLLKLEGVKGESTKGAVPGVEPEEIDVMEEPQEASTDYLLKLEGVKGESTKGNVPGVEPDEIDVAVSPQPVMPDFGILLGGGASSDDDSAGESLANENRTKVEEILLQGMQAEGAPAESISLNYEKIKTKAKQTVKFLGFIPMDITATVEIDADAKVSVKYPWWSFLVSGKDGDSLGAQIFSSISNVLKTKHDTIKNAIGNIR